VHVKAGVGATLYGEFKFVFGKVRLEGVSATFGTKTSMAMDGYWYLRLAGPGATLQLMRAKAYAGIGSIEGRSGPAGLEGVTQRPDISVSGDLTPDDLRDIGRFGGSFGLKYFEVGAEIDVHNLLNDLAKYINK
jgi:hypothetical protein